MKKLTGKAREAFDHWLQKEMIVLPKGGIESLGELLLNALIIEWLDSVDIHIEILHNSVIAHPYPFSYRIVRDWKKIIYAGIPNKLETRQEATGKAITKAVELFNERP